MAGTWITIASQVPWGTLIDKMPDLIDGASRLLRATGKTRKAITTDTDIIIAGSNQVDTRKLQETVASLEASVIALNMQMSEAALLIGELAATNKMLVKGGRAHRRTLIVLAAATILSLVLAGFAFGR